MKHTGNEAYKQGDPLWLWNPGQKSKAGASVALQKGLMSSKNIILKNE